AIFTEELGQDAADVDGLRNSLASLLVMRGDVERGLEEFRILADDVQRREGEESLRTLSAREELASALLRVDRHSEGESVLRDVLAHLPPGDSVEHYMTTRMLAEALANQAGREADPKRIEARMNEALPLALGAVEEAKRLWGPEHSYVALALRCAGQI